MSNHMLIFDESCTFEQKLRIFFTNPLVHNHRIISPELTNKLIEILQQELMVIPQLSKDNPLSLREMLCLLLLASGKTPECCAELMNISLDSLFTYTKRIHKKLKARNRIQAFFTAIQNEYLKMVKI